MCTHVANIWRLRDELKTKTNGASDTINLDPNGNWNVCPVVQAEEELDEKVDVLRAQLVTLTRLCLICERDFVVLNQGKKTDR